MTLVYLDTETTGLDPNFHQVWEIAYAVGPGPIKRAFVEHTLAGATSEAISVNGYEERTNNIPIDPVASLAFEHYLIRALDGATLVGANPAFDAAFLQKRWGHAPWHYRMLDIESFAMPAMPTLPLAKVPSLKSTADYLRFLGHDIPVPDHTAAGDVATLRACHLALIERYTA